MKKITFALIACAALFVGSADVFAQGKWGADSAECVKYMSYYKEYYKQKAYDSAIPNWRKAYQSEYAYRRSCSCEKTYSEKYE